MWNEQEMELLGISISDCLANLCHWDEGAGAPQQLWKEERGLDKNGVWNCPILVSAAKGTGDPQWRPEHPHSLGTCRTFSTCWRMSCLHECCCAWSWWIAVSMCSSSSSQSSLHHSVKPHWLGAEAGCGVFMCPFPSSQPQGGNQGGSQQTYWLY